MIREIPGWVTGDRADRLAGEFAWQAIRKQPGDYAKVVVHDTFMAALPPPRRPCPDADPVPEAQEPAKADAGKDT
jgi:hypothetical protein